MAGKAERNTSLLKVHLEPGPSTIQRTELIGLVASPPGLTRPPFHEAIQLPFRECTKGESFGPSWSTHWFRITLKLPHDFLEKVLPLIIYLKSGTY
jgi:hypothetical protein